MHEAAVRALIACRGDAIAPLLADHTAGALAGMSTRAHGWRCLSMIPLDPCLADAVSGSVCPIGCLLSSMRGRALVTIGASSSSGSSPGGPMVLRPSPRRGRVILFSPRADQAYATAMSFMVGTGLTAAFAAIVKFAMLPA